MEQRWIPVSERLPKKNKKVIIFTKTENLYIGIYCQNIDKEQDGVFLIRDNIYMQIDRIAAWMPLPEPYRGEEPKQTNADKIRSMTDEELAGFIAHKEFYCEDYCEDAKQGCSWSCDNKGKKAALAWLQKESEE